MDIKAERKVGRIGILELTYILLLFSRSVMSNSATPWTSACQASVSFTISQLLLILLSIKWVISSNYLSSVVPFSSCLQSFLAWGSLMSQLIPSGGQSIGVSASASVRPMNIQDWFPLGLFFNESHFAREESWLKCSAIIMNYFWYAT